MVVDFLKTSLIPYSKIPYRSLLKILDSDSGTLRFTDTKITFIITVNSSSFPLFLSRANQDCGHL